MKPTAAELRTRLDRRRAAIAAARAKQDGDVDRRERAIAAAERRERIAAACADLRSAARQADQEAARLAGIVDERVGVIGQADAVLASIDEKAAALRGTIARSVENANTAMVRDPERAASILGTNAGRQAALVQLQATAAQVRQRRADAEAGKSFDDSLGHLRNLLASAHASAKRLRDQAAEDPLGEAQEREVARHNYVAEQTRKAEAARRTTAWTTGAQGRR